MDLIILIVLWCAWCTLHSVMISLKATNYLKNKLESKYRFYRLFYNIIAIITLIPVLLYDKNLSGNVIFQWDDRLLIFQAILTIAVLLLFFSGILKYDMLEFLGIRQIISGKSGLTLSKSGNIDTSGILNLTRHPWYLAAIIFIWICHENVYASTLIVNIVLTIYIVVGTLLEERKLITEYGDEYRRYKDKVSMLVPFKWIISKLSICNAKMGVVKSIFNTYKKDELNP